MKQRILIIGDGFIGSNLHRCYKKTYDVVMTNKSVLDICDPKSIEEYFKLNTEFTHVIYAAGLKDVKYCELNPQEAFEINATSVKKLLPFIGAAQFIYISTDYVFNGSRGNYNEASLAQPKTVYGKSKLLGKWYCEIYGNNAMVVRTSGVYGKNCGWLNWLKSEIDKEGEIVCFADVYNSPTFVDNLAEMIMDMIEHNYHGCINLSGPELMNRYELYKIVFKSYNGDIQRLLSGSSSGTMPHNVSLNSALYQELTSKTPNTVEEGFAALSKERLYEN